MIPKRMDLFERLRHKVGQINLVLEFTSDDLINHFDHKVNDPSASEKCKICKKLNTLRRSVPGLKELVDTGKLKEKEKKPYTKKDTKYWKKRSKK